MKPKLFILLIAVSMAFQGTADAQNEKLITLPDIDISQSDNGIVSFPANTPALFTDIFTKYTKVIAPNGKQIHMLAQSGWTEDQIKKARNVLIYLLTDYPGSKYGDDKSRVANTLSDNKATMVLFDTPEELEKHADQFFPKTDLNCQDLRANECPAEGSEDYMNHITRDASYEEILHLVQGYGIQHALPRFQSDIRTTNDIAAQQGWRGWPADEPEGHLGEYIAAILDNYLDLWTVTPKLYEGRKIERWSMPNGSSHFGAYFASSRERMKILDPKGYILLDSYFHPYLTYTPELPVDFTGTFSIAFDRSVVYTYKSQHLRNVTLTGKNNSSLKGNRYENVLSGNIGDNLLEGGGGNDKLYGNPGIDTAVYSGKIAEYTISRSEENPEIVVVIDNIENRDGFDVLYDVEQIKFNDKTFEVK
ncbi:MAG: hypothetical protein KAI95_05670 [Bacteroidales bacterium]|nr:hypothetical protein [Bacteroidales bacterium]